MDKHIFDCTNRISAAEAASLDSQLWAPPTINEAGHLVYAQSRDGTKRDASGNLTSDGAATVEPDAEANARGYEEGLKKGKAEGLAAGKAEGLSAGKQEAMQQSQQTLQPKLEEVNKLLTSLANSLNEEDYKLEQTMMHLVQSISKAVIRKELQTDPGQIMNVIKETISALPPSRDNIKILLCAADKKIVDEAIEHGGENWRAVLDESITAGGCKIETDQSLVDYTVEQRIQTVLDQLTEQQAVCPKPGEPGYEEAPEPAIKNSSATTTEPKADAPNPASSAE